MVKVLFSDNSYLSNQPKTYLYDAHGFCGTGIQKGYHDPGFSLLYHFSAGKTQQLKTPQYLGTESTWWHIYSCNQNPRSAEHHLESQTSVSGVVKRKEIYSSVTHLRRSGTLVAKLISPPQYRQRFL